MSNKSNKKTSGDYEVGYGKPPKHSRYVKGETGNPFGRGKQKPNLDAALMKQLRRKITIMEGGKPRRIRMDDAVAMRIMSDAAKGKPAAIKEILAFMKRQMEIEANEREMLDNNMSDDEVFAKLTRLFDWKRAQIAHQKARMERIEEEKQKADKQEEDDDDEK